MFSSFPRNALFIIIGLAILILTAYSFEGSTMSFLNKPEEEVVLCSPMEGVITFENTPVAGVKVERLIKWKDDIGETDSVITDKNGHFSFPIKNDTVKLGKLSQFVISQDITVYYQENEFNIWSIGKSSKVEFGELGGKPVNFRCELTDEEVPHRLDNALLLTKCKWDSIEKLLTE